MDPTYSWRVVFMVLLAPVLVVAQHPDAATQRQSDDARGILEKVGSTYRTASSLELKATRIQQAPDDQSENNIDRMPFTLITAGGKFRWEQESKAGTFIHAFDGNQRWMMSASNELPNEYKYAPQDGKPVDPFEFDVQVNLRTPASQLKEARITGKEVLETDLGKRTCIIIEARYEGPLKGYPQVEAGATTFWIDPESYFVWKMRVPFVTDFGNSVKLPLIVTTVYSSIRMNLKVPPETFAPPPPGVKTDSGEAARERAVRAQNATTMSQWEAQLEKDPDNIRLRSELIGEYLKLSCTDPAAERALIRHVLWMVTNQPENEWLANRALAVKPGEDYDAIEKAWLAQVSKPDVTPQVLAIAANFFRPLKPARSLELLAKARALNPGNLMWVFMIGNIYAFQVIGVTVDSQQAEQVKAMLFASHDTELLVAVAGALFQGRGAPAAILVGRQDEIPSLAARQAEIAPLAEELLKRALSLGPTKWHDPLAQFYVEQADYATGEVRRSYLHMAMQEFDAAAATDPEAVSALSPSRYPQIAIEAGELDKAQASAERCLAEIPTLKSDKDINIHRCNLILGGVALRRGDLKRAGEYLLTAARVGGTGTVPFAGPNMILAKELLEKGQRDVVLEYFQLCGKFWPAGSGQLARWTAQVKAGEIPQFGTNQGY
ncbi:MAG: hypothetical protein WBW33_20210 [Bryobacteraceae bacterium]